MNQGNPIKSPAQDRDTERQAIDDRAATTKTQPMARLTAEKAQPAAHEPRSGGRHDGSFMQDRKLDDLPGRWETVQAGFVDDPKGTLQKADRLVAQVIDELSTMFNEERTRLESQWSRNDKVGTEDLRVALQRYRDFFQTLVGR
jgi:hypothetical protein